ncbi:Hypothetical predicted protein [Cloeon dipterum]|uniref:Uncharacterized protein n=1 Tax=Cloeon dipterum TaxID=197152 RepID=A0A8S1DWD7_9INSE|nr:Hypothetical predicted protein [Cloeon dipterum]
MESGDESQSAVHFRCPGEIGDRCASRCRPKLGGEDRSCLLEWSCSRSLDREREAAAEARRDWSSKVRLFARQLVSRGVRSCRWRSGALADSGDAAAVVNPATRGPNKLNDFKKNA